MAGRSSRINGPRKLLAHAASAAAVSSAAATKTPARLESGGGRKNLPLACTMSDLHYSTGYLREITLKFDQFLACLLSPKGNHWEELSGCGAVRRGMLAL